MIGESISHYRILEELGRGGMGVVYKAEDTKLKRIVALKFLPSHLSASDQDRERFTQEAQAAATLNHPNICTIYDIKEEEGHQFIVMEYVDGRTLRDIVGAPLPVDEAVSHAIQIGEALHEAHSKGIVHRDIKSENIMLNSKNQVKVMDFGLAKLKGSMRLTKTSSVVGTLAYMAPEQIQGGNLDARSDIFSFGVVLFEMLTGRLPFRGEHDAALMYSILNEDPEPMRRFSATIPPEVDRIVMRSLQKDPAARYESVREMINELSHAKHRLAHPREMKQDVLKSIAVLPFENISPDKDNEYFSDGLTEEIIANLSKVRRLKVVSRTSVMRYRKSNKPLRQIAGELQAQYVLEGSVRKHRNDLRITAQLIEAEQDVHLWGETYRGTVEDVFDIQEKVAAQITESLKVQLAPDEEKGLRKRGTLDAEAYQRYLRGRFWWNKRTEEGFRRAIGYFEQAIEKDHSYAVAYAGLADCYNLLSAYALVPPEESMPKALAAARAALQCDENLAESHEAIAHVGLLFDWHGIKIESEFLHAIRLNPEYATAYQRYAIYLAATGRLAEALPVINHAKGFDPLSLIINTDVGLILSLMKQFDDAVRQLEKTLEIDPNFSVAHFCLGLTYEAAGRIDDAIKEFEKAVSLSGESTIFLSALGHAFAVSGRTSDAERILNDLLAQLSQRYVSPYSIALVCAGLKRVEESLRWLQAACERRSVWLIHLHLSVDPRLAGFKMDERFIAMTQQI